VISADEAFAEIRGLTRGAEIIIPESTNKLALGDVDAAEAVR
jgi:hypothetical protein